MEKHVVLFRNSNHGGILITMIDADGKDDAIKRFLDQPACGPYTVVAVGPVAYWPSGLGHYLGRVVPVGRYTVKGDWDGK